MTRRTIAQQIKATPPQLDTPMPEPLPLLLNEKSTAFFLGVSLAYLRRSRSEGRTGGRTEAPRFVRVGGRIYYRVVNLQAWVASLESRCAV